MGKRAYVLPGVKWIPQPIDFRTLMLPRGLLSQFLYSIGANNILQVDIKLIFEHMSSCVSLKESVHACAI